MQHDLHITTSRCTDPDPSKINETIFASNEQAESNVQISKESRCTGPGPLRRNEIRVVVDEGALPEEQIPVTKIAIDTIDANLQYLERMNDELLLNHMHSAPMCHDAEIEQPGEGLNTLAEVQYEDHDILGVAPCISIASENVDAHVGVQPCISIASENVDVPITTDEAAPVPAARKRRCDIVDKTNCPPEMVITKRGDVWIVTRLNLEHNHNLLAPALSKLLRSHRYLTDQEKAMIRTFTNVNVPNRKILAFISFLRGGMQFTNLIKKDISNYRTRVMREGGVSE